MWLDLMPKQPLGADCLVCYRLQHHSVSPLALPQADPYLLWFREEEADPVSSSGLNHAMLLAAGFYFFLQSICLVAKSCRTSKALLLPQVSL